MYFLYGDPGLGSAFSRGLSTPLGSVAISPRLGTGLYNMPFPSPSALSFSVSAARGHRLAAGLSE